MDMFSRLIKIQYEKKQNKKYEKFNNYRVGNPADESRDLECVKRLQKTLAELLSRFVMSGMKKDFYSDIVVLNIGEPTVLSDAVGPIVGSELCSIIKQHRSTVTSVAGKADSLIYSLRFQGKRFQIKNGFITPDITVYGTKNEPVNEDNYKSVIEHISQNHKNPFIIVTDTGVCGLASKTGTIAVRDGSIKPGKGAGKNYEEVGNVSITGIIGVDVRLYKGDTADDKLFLHWLDCELDKNADLITVYLMAVNIAQAIRYSLIDNPN